MLHFNQTAILPRANARTGIMAMRNSELSNFRVVIITSGIKMTAVNSLLISIIFHHSFRQSGDHANENY